MAWCAVNVVSPKVASRCVLGKLEYAVLQVTCSTERVHLIIHQVSDDWPANAHLDFVPFVSWNCCWCGQSLCHNIQLDGDFESHCNLTIKDNSSENSRWDEKTHDSSPVFVFPDNNWSARCTYLPCSKSISLSGVTFSLLSLCKWKERKRERKNTRHYNCDTFLAVAMQFVHKIYVVNWQKHTKFSLAGLITHIRQVKFITPLGSSGASVFYALFLRQTLRRQFRTINSWQRRIVPVKTKIIHPTLDFACQLNSAINTFSSFCKTIFNGKSSTGNWADILRMQS